jgi:hypothetical protein
MDGYVYIEKSRRGFYPKTTTIPVHLYGNKFIDGS